MTTTPVEHFGKLWQPATQPRWRWACSCGATGGDDEQQTAAAQLHEHAATHR